jgi:hypothetical protein
MVSVGLVALTVALTPVALAQTNSWTNSVSGRWENAGNWSLGSAPSNTQWILITNDTSKTVTMDAATAGFPTTLTITNLTLSAPNLATNTLSLTSALSCL